MIQVLSLLKGPALSWAKKNLGEVGRWIANGMSFKKVVVTINNMFK
ncbi:aureocin A53 family class IId bacteriocin [Virgibacillus pantothenticus]